MNDLVGSVVLTIILAAIFYFIVASKTRMGFDTTMFLMIPILLIIGLAFASFQAILAFTTIILAYLIAWIFQYVIGNR